MECLICKIPLRYTDNIGYHCTICGYNHKGYDNDPKPSPMLRGLVTTILLLISFLTFSQVNISGSVELGGIEDKWSMTEENYLRTYSDSWVAYAEIQFNFEWKNINLEQTLFNTFDGGGDFKEDFTFRPLEITYKTKIYYQIKQLSLGMEHLCMHPIINQTNDVYENSINAVRRQSWNKFFVKYEFIFNK